MPEGPDCPVCAAAMAPRFDAVVLGRHRVRFDHCAACGLVRSEPPWWLAEAYGQAISATDCGLVARNLEIARLLSILFSFRLPAHGQVLDHAGGSGLLVRMLRDAGFDAWWEDRYADNLHARGFAASPGRYHAVTMFEVLEHLSDPYAHLASIVAERDPEMIVISTTTYGGEPPAPGTWDYYAFETGQHISFYQERTLARLAARLGYGFERLGMIRVLGRCRQVPGWMRILADRRIHRRLDWLVPRRPSLLPGDHARLRGQDGG